MMSNVAYPKRGEVWLVNFNPGRGSEQKGIRPALIVQNDIGNEFGSTTIVSAITTSIKPFPVTVLLPEKAGGLKKRSMVNTAQLLTIDKTRLMEKIGALERTYMAQVDQAVGISVGLERD
jgi:mRNA interferase MazF